MEIPRGRSEAAVARYATILADAAVDLGQHSRRSLTVEGLQEAVRVYNRQRALLAELKGAWLAGRVATAAYRRLRRTALTRDPQKANQDIEQMLAEVQQTEPESSGGCRVMILAELAAPNSLVRMLEASGARPVAEDSDLDELALGAQLDDSGQSLEALLTELARAYLDKPPAPRMRDVPRRLEHLSRLTAGRQVQAVICAFSKFCDLRLAEWPLLQSFFEELGIPAMLLELEDEGAGGQHRTRVQAFLEMVGSC
jgi:benzoyl-CoA reductase/2-hydroxyglutaryl-CoA dehydratase subunit BcrC/BadD/HgdB